MLLSLLSFPSHLIYSEIRCICPDLCGMQLCSQVLNRYMHVSCTSLLLPDIYTLYVFHAVPLGLIHPFKEVLDLFRNHG